MRIRAAAISFAVITLALVACSSDDDPTVESGGAGTTASTSASPGGDQHNDADVAFVQGMIPHHEQAVEMAELAFTRADDSRVKELASTIKEAQEPEIETMTAWLDQWGEAMDMGEHGADDMGGTMSEGEMAELESATGPAFDRAFLEMMIEHHRGAIAMAEREMENGKHPDAMELAGEIVSAQTAEIEEMERLLDSLG